MTTQRSRDRVLKAINRVWKTHPELRLGQLLLNVISDYEMYAITDKDLARRLKVCYAMLKGRL